MRVFVTGDYAKMSKKAALVFLNQLTLKPNSVFGLATGSTPIGLYKELIKNYKDYSYDFSSITTFNLDEYLGLGANHSQSYNYFMHHNLFKHINISKNNIYIPQGDTKNPQEFCNWYEQQIDNKPIDLQILGIGSNGHIAFNEPDSKKNSKTRIVNLDEKTIQDNARFFKNKSQVPTQAISMGIDTILKAKKIIILAYGKNKAQAVKQMIEGPISEKYPASFLQNHPDVTVIIDRPASSLLKNDYSQTENGSTTTRILKPGLIPKNKKILVISPHHDDSAVACGANLRALAVKNKVYVLIMTDGHHANIDSLNKNQRIKLRKSETISESKILNHQAMFGDFKFYNYGTEKWNEDLTKLKKFWNKTKPDIVFLPHERDQHPTHELSTKLTLDYIKKNKIKNVTLCFYEGPWVQHSLDNINLIFSFDEKLLAVKNAAIAQHESQIKRLSLIKASEALAQFRAATIPELKFANHGQQLPNLGEYIEAYHVKKI